MQILLYGSREFAFVVSALARQCGYQVTGLVDDFDCSSSVLGTFDSITSAYPPSHYSFAIAIGYNNLKARWSVWQRVKNAGYTTPALIHPEAYVADSATVSEGAMIMSRAIVDSYACIAELVVLWPGACVNHHSRVGANNFISPNATIAGYVETGPHSFVGAGAVVTDHVNVPAENFIKAGSVFSGKRMLA